MSDKRQIDPQSSLQALHDGGPLYAKAKAERVYLEEYRKSLKALLMQKSACTAAVGKEMEAYADPEYIQHLQAIRVAVEREEAMRWRLVTAQTAVDIWRSQAASNRAMDRAAA